MYSIIDLSDGINAFKFLFNKNNSSPSLSFGRSLEFRENGRKELEGSAAWWEAKNHNLG